ncbi:hypothetical protein GCM10017083_38340 [Thalassobaculum fulvum]|uniref:Post-segregation antitoxin CcdA n=1 Tax=Thalassobaculum fulvum TaxID=1633335 RepID=A0A918XVQ2_9PROT|nr:type II toxin-antitoxin system CcdA family antitoxin [Thalassobaculum fulvum]GHD57196.1 hypothetical protein GCM10017083_38340 [Thalassobaculum fulvum]
MRWIMGTLIAATEPPVPPVTAPVLPGMPTAGAAGSFATRRFPVNGRKREPAPTRPPCQGRWSPRGDGRWAGGAGGEGVDLICDQGRTLMPKARVTVSVDSDLLEQARQRSVDLDRAAEVGLRRALDRQVDDRLQDWVDRHRENLARKAERDRTQGLANERLRAF